MEMELEVNLCSCLDQPAGAFGKHVTFLADCILIEENSLFSHFKRSVRVIELPAMAGFVCGLHDRGSDVVDYRESLNGDDLDTFYIAILGQTGIDKNVRPLIGRLGPNHDVLGQIDDDVRLADLPRFFVFELASRRHVGRITLWRSAVNPFNDDGDFLVR